MKRNLENIIQMKNDLNELFYSIQENKTNNITIQDLIKIEIINYIHEKEYICLNTLQDIFWIGNSTQAILNEYYKDIAYKYLNDEFIKNIYNKKHNISVLSSTEMKNKYTDIIINEKCCDYYLVSKVFDRNYKINKLLN